MNNAIIPQAKRRPGRPRKSVNISSYNKLTFTPRGPKRRKDASDDPEVIDQNGFNVGSKKPRLDDGQPVRSQPPRRARYTESYDGEGTDVVVVSDEDSSSEDSDSSEDCGPIPSPPCKKRTPEEQRLWEENVERLKKTLSDEEMRLVLLRKLQESQKSRDPRREAAGSPSPAALRAATASSSITLKGGVQIQPMPSKQLLSNNKYTSAKKDVKQEIPNCRSIPKSTTTFKPIQPSLKSVSNSPIALTVPKSAEPVNNHHLNQYPLLKNLSNQITITAVPPTQTNNPSPSVNKQVEEKLDSETLAQRQAAAKLALRKQLEKTLLQIPLPKPPPLKINFFPNANSIEFLCLLGLDYVVDCLTKSKKNSTTSKVPLTCAQCSTDFTCTWKWKEVERNGKKAYDAYCEACITSNIRKGLKAQHTNNLKSAFLKALQQEKEIDRLTHLPPPPPPKSHRESPSASAVSQASQQHHQQQQHHHHHHHQQQSRNRVPTPAHQANSSSSIPKAMPYIPKAPMPQGLNHAAALAQLSKLGPQYQSLLHAQQLLAGVPLHPGMLSLSPFMTQPPSRGHKSASQGDGRRQRYRTDRVQSPSIPQASSSWKA